MYILREFLANSDEPTIRLIWAAMTNKSIFIFSPSAPHERVH
jgi:hypothetical protein